MAIFSFRRSEDGQVGLVILLIGAVLLTLSIGAASQSVVGTKTARQELDSSQAFNFAEQGIEEALSQLLAPVGSTTIPGLPAGYSGTYSVTEVSSYTGTVVQGRSVNVRLPGTASGTFDVEWTSSGCGSIIVTLLSSAWDITRSAYRPQSCLAASNFVGVATNHVTIPYGANDVLARIKAVAADVSVTVTGANLPTQSYDVVATASLDNSNEARSVQVNKGLSSLPSIFDYTLFSGSGNLAQ